MSQVAKDGSVLSFGNSFFTGKVPSAKSSKNVDAKQALVVAQEGLDLRLTKISESSLEGNDDTATIKGVSGVERDPEANLLYFVKPDGKLALTWKVKAFSEDAAFTSYVDVETDDGKLVGVINHDSHFTYQV